MKDAVDEREHLQLFDLIAREWALSSRANRTVFNNDATALAFDCEDGSIRLAATACKDSPNQRTRRAVDDGRLTIAPRTKPVGALKSADYTKERSSAVVPHGPECFAFGTKNGRINVTTPGGVSVYLPHKVDGPVNAVAATAQSDGPLVFASGCQVYLVRTGTADTPEVVTLPADVTTLGLSPDGTALAIGHGNGISVWTFAAETPGFELDLAATNFCWSGDGRWLACGLRTAGFALIDVRNQTAVTHDNFPGVVRSTGFGADMRTIVASGAFRLVSWELEEPDKSIVTGKSGLVLIDHIACCPTKNLVAVGYSNGLISVSQIGNVGEILLRADTGITTTAMSWSPNGLFLGLAGADGSAALVEFPDDMFKP